ncbi:MAG: hypothetical protein AAGB34_07970 [Planctomycetota bacterium]
MGSSRDKTDSELPSVRSIVARSIAAGLLGVAVMYLFRHLLESGEVTETASSHVKTIVVGAFFGALSSAVVELLRVFFVVAERLRENSEALGRVTGDNELFSPVNELLLRVDRHSKTVRDLVKAMLSKREFYVAYTDLNSYRTHLISAIGNSENYHGIKRDTISSFVPGDDDSSRVEIYLRSLRTKDMKEKHRVFVISDDEEEKMKQELSDQEIVKNYWELNGPEVKTHWITVGSLLKNYPDLELPDDCGIYDRELKISYDHGKSVMKFSLVDQAGANNSAALAIFEKLNAQTGINEKGPFLEIAPPRGVGYPADAGRA